MIYLLFSILAATLIFIIFKQLGKYKINTIQAIIVNYFTACITGILLYEEPIQVSKIIQENWFFGAVGLGILFFSIFIVMALTAQRNGLTVASVATKMSVVIPIIFGLYAYQESLGWQKGIGIILALAAVYLTATKKSKDTFKAKSLWLPVILFLGSGVIDTSIKYLETTYVSKNGIPIFSATIFCFAGIIGIIAISIQAIKGTFKIDYRSIFGGIILGITNYFSIYLLLKALQIEGFESSTIFTVNNVAIVMLSTLIVLIIFNEKLQTKNWIGILLAIISIVLVTLA